MAIAAIQEVEVDDTDFDNLDNYEMMSNEFIYEELKLLPTFGIK